jgi:NADH-quinone oxidoreductase subunit A
MTGAANAERKRLLRINMTLLVFYLLVFLAVGVFFLFFHLMLGKLIRPARPETDKLTIYECGEPTIGSAWIQFDLRYYVVALLFVIFDVEIAFFFPWAIVFGDANTLSNPELPDAKRAAITKELIPTKVDGKPTLPALPTESPDVKPIDAGTARSWAIIAFMDILVFFGVLMVGFAYLWRRGDINWVRSTAAEKSTAAPPLDLPQTSSRELAAVGRS